MTQVRPVTTEGKLLARISAQLDELLGILRVERAPSVDEKPAPAESDPVEVRGVDIPDVPAAPHARQTTRPRQTRTSKKKQG